METRDPADLKIHPFVAALPELPKESATLLWLVEDIRARGIQTPLLCIPPDQIIDGRERWRAAKRLQLESVPVMWEASGEVASTIWSGLCRKHFSKGALAYLVIPMIKTLLTEATARGWKNLQKGQQIPVSTELTPENDTLRAFAARSHFSHELLYQAKTVRDALSRDKKRYRFLDAEDQDLTLREYFEPRILDQDRPMGLGRVLEGIGWLQAHGHGDPRTAPRQMELFTAGVGTILKRFDYWIGFDETQRRLARQRICNLAAELEPERCNAIAEWFSETGRLLRQSLKQ